MIRKRTGKVEPNYEQVERWAGEPHAPKRGEPAAPPAASPEPTNVLPWETEQAQARADVYKQYPLRLREPYMTALGRLAHVHQQSKQQYLQQVLEAALERDAREQYGRAIMRDMGVDDT